MKKLLFILLISMFSISLNAQNITIEALRREYYKVTADSISCAKLYGKIEKDNSNDNLIIGYKGAITSAMANHVKNKSDKLKLFNAGKKLIDNAIIVDDQNIELHFLRFTIQTNCPKALGYCDQITKDKNFILSNLETIKNVTLRNKMESFLLESKQLTEAEKKQINIEK